MLNWFFCLHLEISRGSTLIQCAFPACTMRTMRAELYTCTQSITFLDFSSQAGLSYAKTKAQKYRAGHLCVVCCWRRFWQFFFGFGVPLRLICFKFCRLLTPHPSGYKIHEQQEIQLCSTSYSLDDATSQLSRLSPLRIDPQGWLLIRCDYAFVYM